ncbi:MAG TPA: succinate dehydrogenase cytochrome b subunit [Cyclobacteriaceae bacterium]|nr:succinate dehydrogenase cytochrome b subunit [Cyclobacteriaceae bacterium]
MKWLLDLFSSTLGRKLVMALTGLFLISFLLVHLIGNLQLLKNDGGHAFNVYAEFMSTNPLIQTISKGNFAFILIHILWSTMLTIRNRNARGPEGYAVTKSRSIWSSRNMGILGTIILVFLVIHLKDFWAQMHYGGIPTVNYEGKEVRDIYTIVAYWFEKDWYVALYVFCMVGVAFHLWHGFISAFQTLGLNHMKYNPVINFVGKAFSILVPALFALIPVWMYLN